MKSIILAIVTSVLVSSSFSQVALPSQDQKKEFSRSVFGLGASASFVSGFGLSFRQHLPSAFSYQVAFGIIKSGGNVLYNLGGEVEYDIIRAGETRFYVCGGTGYFYSGSSGDNELAGPYRIGAGVGGEWRSIESFHIGGGLLFTYFNDGTILPLPEISAHYYFY